MSRSASHRQRQSPARRALGLFAAVWLNLALQPCAMAYEVDDHDCPHCPPAETHAHSGSHEGMSQAMPCADGIADCTIDAEWSHDARGTKSKLKDAPSELPVAIVPVYLATTSAYAEPAPPPRRDRLLRAGAPPPLHVLHCVYLD